MSQASAISEVSTELPSIVPFLAHEDASVRKRALRILVEYNQRTQKTADVVNALLDNGTGPDASDRLKQASIASLQHVLVSNKAGVFDHDSALKRVESIRDNSGTNQATRRAATKAISTLDRLRAEYKEEMERQSEHIQKVQNLIAMGTAAAAAPQSPQQVRSPSTSNVSYSQKRRDTPQQIQPSPQQRKDVPSRSSALKSPTPAVLFEGPDVIPHRSTTPPTVSTQLPSSPQQAPSQKQRSSSSMSTSSSALVTLMSSPKFKPTVEFTSNRRRLSAGTRSLSVQPTKQASAKSAPEPIVREDNESSEEAFAPFGLTNLIIQRQSSGRLQSAERLRNLRLRLSSGGSGVTARRPVLSANAASQYVSRQETQAAMARDRPAFSATTERRSGEGEMHSAPTLKLRTKSASSAKSGSRIVQGRVAALSASGGATNDLEPSELGAMHNPGKELQNAVEKLSDTSLTADWKILLGALSTVRRAALFHTSLMRSQLATILRHVCHHTSSLRSRISKAALQTLGEIYESLGRSTECVEKVHLAITCCLKRLGGANAFQASAAEETIAKIVLNTDIERLLPVIEENAGNASATIRSKVAQLFCLVVHSYREEALLLRGKAQKYRGMSNFTIGLAVQFAVDASSNTRFFGKRACALLWTYSPRQCTETLAFASSGDKKAFEQSTKMSIESLLEADPATIMEAHVGGQGSGSRRNSTISELATNKIELPAQIGAQGGRNVAKTYPVSSSMTAMRAKRRSTGSNRTVRSSGMISGSM